MDRNNEPITDWLLLDHQLCFALYSSSLAMTKLYKPLLSELGLTYPQYLVMLVLWETQTLSVSELGKRLALDSGTLTPLLKRLAAMGMVTRTRDVADGRRVLVSLTGAGRALRQRATGIPEQMLCATQCPVEEIQALTRRLHALRSTLEQARTDSSLPD
ncbi:Organic hydroperoxide resistance transcriptional regulator, MarR family [Cupriavidus taiwanensis]|uniref:Organic hydroperoxide resistance transcriptional regulator, MarR family n=1 Tax=Cupriavidus taiwanensis TaxID=164546 RepID=A0A375BYA7_9BURK|nr:MarR family transcriptional regulator [Cupriavidus taiwanensis]SOY58356.1 Organic hydroperoxide resistance transcriptional regulator, MarR family [Cupriavidus taiwanensis]